MTRNLFFLLVIALFAVISNLSCKKEHSCESCATGTLTANLPPVACAGPDQTITLPDNTVQLDGRCSADPNNNITSYAWTKISGPASFQLLAPGAVQTNVTGLTEGVYQFELTVTDGGGLFSRDTVQVIVNDQATSSNVDIYIAGESNLGATYWKNGVPVQLKGSKFNSSATAIAVVGTDVYVAGWDGDGFSYGQNVAKYWKNGVEVILTGPSGAWPTAIAVSGSDVYVAGWEVNGSGSVAKYWKNGVAVNLTNGIEEDAATDIKVVGGDVYVSGYENGVAKYWKNGVGVSLTDGRNQAFGNSIAVVGNDVYVAGSEWNHTAQVAKYWKNGKSITLTDGKAYSAAATSIAVSGSDVYVAGWEGDHIGMLGGNASTAKYWKNGVAVNLSNGSGYAYTNTLVLYNGDVYVCGFEYHSSHKATYWKNGPVAPIKLTGGIWAIDMVVVPK